MELTVGITGASGTIYAFRTLQMLAASGQVKTINLIMSDVAPTVAQIEIGADIRTPDRKSINKWLGLPRNQNLSGFGKIIISPLSHLQGQTNKPV